MQSKDERIVAAKAEDASESRQQKNFDVYGSEHQRGGLGLGSQAAPRRYT